jgi:hypothetical protein
VLLTWSRPELLLLAGFGLFSALLWRVPGLGLIFYPFRLLNTYVHELCHGLAAILTGGRFERFAVHPNREGVAFFRGGSSFVVYNAGYLGAALFGGGLILLSTAGLEVQNLLFALGAGLALVCLGFARNAFGFIAGLALAGGLVAAALYLPVETASFLYALLAIQMPLAAANSVVDLIKHSMHPPRPGHLSDAQVMARDTGIPALIWSLFWLACSLVIVVVTVTLAYRDVPLL